NIVQLRGEAGKVADAAVVGVEESLYVQLIDDSIGSTLVGLSTLSKSLKGKVKATVGGAKELGKKIAEQALEKGIQNVIFDRGGFRYHGQLKALADAAREAGLKF
ncbi:MAG: 50S ribosomal protein L18, partial [bacterium]|nr:50S ribosomal protein L18 [bacterium]